MILFNSDYTQGAHPGILEKLGATNADFHPGYGEDAYCLLAQRHLRDMIRMPQAALHFVAGGTQANLTVIASLLRPHQGVAAVDTGHISVHETGAIEATGHKVLALPQHEGKMRPQDLKALIDSHHADASFEHSVQPGMVYLSQSTELGSVYTKAELQAIRAVCLEYGLPLYIDGARLGYALASLNGGLTLEDIARLCDAFTIGMTKQGALFGEAIVLCNPALQKDFRYLIKQRGGMLAKGWLMGLQFEALFEDNLYFELSSHAVGLAVRLRDGLAALGVPFYARSPSNQQFPILPKAALDSLSKDYGFSHIASLDEGRAAVRFCTSWATREEDVDALLRDIAALLQP